ncbi:MAG TPA: LPXTG cell wall anchor domain-containing protein [Candidatus Saccharibacteria bacterium]|nr:LPXTG cell wall anchor domain-containing protein [Candidatus Saccharibacteria bacterium]HRQ97805.1 LPXTG cell wall anchor domain-containing protein [Candidatus Saccharibacteria bacterium]
MVKLHRTNQGGSVVNFVIISVILVLAVASVAYVVTKRGEQARKDIAIATINEQTNNSQDSKTTKPPVNESEGDKVATNDPEKSQDTATNTPVSSNELPQTGPVQNAVQLVAVGLISLAVFSYINSRRQLAHSL